MPRYHNTGLQLTDMEHAQLVSMAEANQKTLCGMVRILIEREAARLKYPPATDRSYFIPRPKHPRSEMSLMTKHEITGVVS